MLELFCFSFNDEKRRTADGMVTGLRKGRMDAEQTFCFNEELTAPWQEIQYGAFQNG